MSRTRRSRVSLSILVVSLLLAMPAARAEEPVAADQWVGKRIIVRDAGAFHLDEEKSVPAA